METGKRKRPGDGRDDERQRAPRGPARVEAVSEAEVEEFFAILRRMHDANKCLAATRDSGARPEGPSRWRPAFSWEDFVRSGTAGDGVKKDAGRGEDAAAAAAVENGTARGLDLNAEPEPEPEPLVDAATRCTRAQS